MWPGPAAFARGAPDKNAAPGRKRAGYRDGRCSFFLFDMKTAGRAGAGVAAQALLGSGLAITLRGTTSLAGQVSSASE